MQTREKTTVSKSGVPVTNDTAASSSVTDDHAPRKLTFAENAILTIKVLAVSGFIGVAFWALNRWVSAE